MNRHVLPVKAAADQTDLRAFQGITEIPVKMDLIRDPVRGFEGASFTGKVTGGFGEVSITLNRNVNSGKDAIILNWFPEGAKGKIMHIEQRLGAPDDEVLMADISSDKGGTVFNWVGPKEKPAAATTYRALVAHLVPMMRFAGYDEELIKHVGGKTEGLQDDLKRMGYQGPEQLLEVLKAKALGHETPAKGNPTQLPDLRKPSG
jgi:hypothetical protein